MIKKIIVFALCFTLVFSLTSCNKPQNNVDSTEPAIEEPGEENSQGNQGEKNLETIKNVLEKSSITIKGAYTEIDPNTGEIRTVSSGEPLIFTKEVAGTFGSIENIEILGSEQNIGVSFKANIVNDYFQLEEKQEFMAILKEESSTELSFLSANLKDTEKEPFITPTVPLSVDLFYSENVQLRLNISEDEKELFAFDDSIKIEDLPTFQNPYLVTIPLTKETVTSIEFFPVGEDIAIRESSFSLVPLAKFTLANGTVLEGKLLIEHKTSKWNLGLGENDTAANCKLSK